MLLLFKLIKSSAVVNHLFNCIGCAKYYLSNQSMAEEMGVRSAATVALCTRGVVVVYSALIIHLGM
jgi:hypothetical protein